MQREHRALPVSLLWHLLWSWSASVPLCRWRTTRYRQFLIVQQWEDTPGRFSWELSGNQVCWSLTAQLNRRPSQIICDADIQETNIRNLLLTVPICSGWLRFFLLKSTNTPHCQQLHLDRRQLHPTTVGSLANLTVMLLVRAQECSSGLRMLHCGGSLLKLLRTRVDPVKPSEQFNLKSLAHRWSMAVQWLETTYLGEWCRKQSCARFLCCSTTRRQSSGSEPCMRPDDGQRWVAQKTWCDYGPVS